MNKIYTVSKARQLYDILREDILQGKYDDSGKLPSIRQLADEYQLSKNTVNTVIAMLVNEGLAVVREGNGTFVTGEKQKVRMIGVMLFDFGVGMRVDNNILEHIQKNITPDYYLSLVNTSNRYDVFGDGLKRLLEAEVAGFLVIPPKDEPQSADELMRVQALLRQRPTVFINRSIPDVEADTYSMDLKGGLELAFEYLITSGKRNTAVVLHDSNKFVQEELAAYAQCCDLYGLAQQPDLLIPWSEDAQEIREKLQPVLSRIDSIICPDNMLVQLDETIKATGRQIPAELSLIGINDTICSRLFYPPLTSIAFPVERIGRHAIRKLIKRIEGTDRTAPVAHNFLPEFIIRKT